LTKEEEDYYELYFDLFSSKGWKQFVADTQSTYNSFTIEQIKDSDQLSYVKGQRLVLENVLQFETLIRSAYDSIQEQSNVDEV